MTAQSTDQYKMEWPAAKASHPQPLPPASGTGAPAWGARCDEQREIAGYRRAPNFSPLVGSYRVLVAVREIQDMGKVRRGCSGCVCGGEASGSPLRW